MPALLVFSQNLLFTHASGPGFALSCVSRSHWARTLSSRHLDLIESAHCFCGKRTKEGLYYCDIKLTSLPRAFHITAATSVTSHSHCFVHRVGGMLPRVMSPNRREMDQLAVSQQEGDFIESIVNSGPQEIVGPPEMQEMLSSLTDEDLAMVPGLMERVQEFRRARLQSQGQFVEAPQASNGLQEILDEVAGQVPGDEGSPDDSSPSSTPHGEGCGVCERSFRNRGPVAICAGCTKKSAQTTLSSV